MYFKTKLIVIVKTNQQIIQNSRAAVRADVTMSEDDIYQIFWRQCFCADMQSHAA